MKYSDFHDLAKAKGWWPEDTNVEERVPEKLALIHSEISEALEEFRNGHMHYYKEPSDKPAGFGIELADAIIRIGDLWEALRRAGLVDDHPLEDFVEIKHAYNKTRPFRHGNKKA